MKAYSKCPHRSPIAVSDFVKDIIKDKRVCELGCAEGDNMVFMARYAKEVIGLEYDDSRLRVAVERGLNVIKGDYYKDKLPPADVYYFWPNDGVKDNEFLVDKIYSNDQFHGTIIVAGDTGFPPEPPVVKRCAEKWGGAIEEVKFNEGNEDRQSGAFILAVIMK
jgi:hypothetical protein|tara:strand:+ start:3479 stop:3970 length:492 start_codon:yes stop_codon:yes gene_type:complete